MKKLPAADRQPEVSPTVAADVPKETEANPIAEGEFRLTLSMCRNGHVRTVVRVVTKKELDVVNDSYHGDLLEVSLRKLYVKIMGRDALQE